MNAPAANTATFVKTLTKVDNARLYRLTRPVVIYDGGFRGTTDYVVVSKWVLPAVSFAGQPVIPAKDHVSVWASDEAGCLFNASPLARLTGSEHTHEDALAAIGYATVVESWDTSTDGTSVARFEVRDGVLHVLGFDYTPPAPLPQPSFMAYCQAIYPDRDWPQHFEICSEAVEAMLAGESTRVQTNAPPQHGTTTLALLSLAYAIGCNPSNRYLYATYSQGLAETLRDLVIRILTSRAHQDLFPSTALVHISANELMTNKGGHIVFANPGFGGTGCSFDGVVIDDPFSDLDQRLDEDTLAGFDSFFGGAVLPHITPATWVHLLNARLGSDWKYANGEWECLDFPALSGEELALWPEHQNRKLLRATRDAIPPYFWELYFQQNVDGFKQYM
jgi:hypothetical protein